MRQREAGRGLQVVPLRETHVVQPVGAGRGADVLAVGDQQRRQAGAVQRGRHVQVAFAVAAQPVHDDRPRARAAGDQPCRHRPQLVGHSHVGKRQPQRLHGSTEIHVGVDDDARPRREMAAQRAQPPRDRVRAGGEHAFDARATGAPLQAVHPWSLGGRRARERHAARREPLHGGVGPPRRLVGHKHLGGEVPARRGTRREPQDHEQSRPSEQRPPPPAHPWAGRRSRRRGGLRAPSLHHRRALSHSRTLPPAARTAVESGVPGVHRESGPQAPHHEPAPQASHHAGQTGPTRLWSETLSQQGRRSRHPLGGRGPAKAWAWARRAM